MSLRARIASVVVVLLLASASASSAQQADTTAAVHRTGDKPGRAAIGGQIGVPWIFEGGDYAKGAQPRLSFMGSYRYQVTRGLRWQVSPYFAWNAYRTGTRMPFSDPDFPFAPGNLKFGRYKDSVLTQIVGANAQLQLTRIRNNWVLHLGAGPSLYRVVVQNERKVIKDPVTFDYHQGAYLGVTAELGLERFMKSLPNTSLEWTIAWQEQYAMRNQQFPSGFNGNPQELEIRFGAHYYYDFKPEKKTVELPKHP
ncbi:MAG TPA: hypothetical protein VMH61_07635 [Candidatus Acidoferrales bacterium]|nr:hypothetical protein [Candidatus Acidoferrales bacterium]